MSQTSWPIMIAVLMPIVTGCQQRAPIPSTTAPVSQSVSKTGAEAESKVEANVEQQNSAPKDSRQIAAAAKDEMFKRLSKTLLEAMSQGGPAAAIEVCSKSAPKIARQVGQEFGVTLGRTSFKLRNSKNVPPDWAVPILENRPTEPRFVDLPDHHTGALFPISLKVQCLACHGAQDQISADVKAQLERIYPDDQATGFKEGDLRGWFWVDVPARTVITPSE